MKIKSIAIKNFGKLKDFSLSFEEGFNVLYGENEQGKSTIMAFLRMMFYGTAGRGGDLSKNIRKRYTPWDGSKMNGSMEFSHEGVCYRLEKIFAATPKSDIIKLWNQSTNELEPLTEQREIGRRFLGMGEDTFEKSVFIGQIGSVINTEKDKENEIIQKLQNLASSGDETQSFHLIESRILSAIEKIKSRGGKIGILDRLQQEQSRLEEERVQAIATEDAKERMRKTYQELLDKKEREETILDEKSKEAGNIRQYEEFQELQRILLKNESIEQLAKEQNGIDKQLVNGEFKVDQPFLEESGRQLQDLIRRQAILQSRQEELFEKEKSLRVSSQDPSKSIDREEFEPVNELYKQILTEEERIKMLQFSLQQEKFAEKEAIQAETVLQANRIKIEEYQTRIEQLKREMDQPLTEEKGLPSESSGKKDTKQGKSASRNRIRIPTGVYIIGIIFILMFAITGYLVHPLFYIGGLALILLIFITWLGLSKKMQTLQDKTVLTNAAIRERNSQIESNILFLQKELDSLVQQQAKIDPNRADNGTLNSGNAMNPNISLNLHTSANPHTSSNPRTSSEIRIVVDTIRRSLEETLESLETKRAIVKESFVRHQVDSFEDFNGRYIETRNYLDQKNNTVKEIQDYRNQTNSQKKEYEENLQMFMEHISNIGSFVNTDLLQLPEKDRLKIIKDKLEELTQQFYTASNRLAVLEEKKKNLEDRIKTRSISAIRQEYETMKANLTMDIFQSMDQGQMDEEIKILEKQIETLTSDRNSTDIALARTKSEMTQAFLDKPELSIIVDELEKNEKSQSEYQMRYTALTLAKTQMEQAFLEMQQTFGPIVNRRTAEIFSEITNGKYRELLVSKDLNISFRDPLMDTTQEWQYLSGGTIDQVYFSLRLAISGFLTDQIGGLPLFIDDAFLQYDDSRTRQGMLFLADYASTQQVQILYFTCHQSLYEQCGADANRMDLSK